VHDANTLSSQTPTRRGLLLSGGPALHHLQRHLFLLHHHPRPVQHHSMSIATFPTNARLEPKRGTTRTTTRGLSSNTTALSVLFRRLRCSRWPGPHTAVEVGSCFVGECFLSLFSRLWECGIVGVPSCVFRCERFCGAGISLRGRDIVLRGGRGGRVSGSCACL
jgi:hypothetical protein